MTTVAMAYHVPVLVGEVVEGLRVRPGGVYIDCTAGEGGHARAILEASAPGGRLLGIDLDPQALQTAEEQLGDFSSSFVLVNDNFANLMWIAKEQGFCPAGGVLLDLGLSSLHLEGEARGFTFQREEPLDMRFDPRQEVTAWDVVNGYSVEELARVIVTYGEDYRARRIAQAIVQNRPIDTSLHLARVVLRAVGHSWSRIHPATRTFQAIRMVVNGELESLEIGLRQAVSLLRSGGRLVVLSYHSLEDRLVKNFLRKEAQEAKSIRLVTKKVITPSREEVRKNPRCRSARMRVAEHM